MNTSVHPSASASGPASSQARQPVPGRACGTCTLCCKVVAVNELAKPNGVWCQHCLRSKGCAIYDSRPASCREFNCEWILNKKLGPEWKPDRAKFVLLVTLTSHLTACVDPGFPSAWLKPPYYGHLKRWAQQQAEDAASAWPAVDVWIGQRCIVILPDRDVDLGVVGAEEAIRVDRKMGETGEIYEAQKFTRITSALPNHQGEQRITPSAAQRFGAPS